MEIYQYQQNSQCTSFFGLSSMSQLLLCISQVSNLHWHRSSRSILYSPSKPSYHTLYSPCPGLFMHNNHMQTIADLLILCVLEVLSCQRLLTSNLVIRILATKGERIGTVGLVYKLFSLQIRALQEYTSNTSKIKKERKEE